MKKAILAIASTLFVACSLSTSEAGVSTGSAAPEFTLIDSNGTQHSLSDFKGKHVVLEWTNFRCPFVGKHYDSNNMQNLQKKYTGKGVVWLTICSSASGKQGHDSPEGWNETIRDSGASPTALLIDESGDVGRLYAAKTTPHMYVVNPEGVLVYQGAIDSIRGVNASDIKDADNYVQAALDASMAGKSVETDTTSSYGCGIKY